MVIRNLSYNIDANEDFVLWFASKLLTCFIDTLTSEWNPNQLILYGVEVHT